MLGIGWDQCRGKVWRSGRNGRLALSCLLAVRIEETWRLWQKFLDDYSRFEDWLTSAERTAASPNSSEVLYTVAKEELKKFEVRPAPALSWGHACSILRPHRCPGPRHSLPPATRSRPKCLSFS